MTDDIADEYEAYSRPIIEEAKADYDLGKRLRTRPSRVETVRVYTDEVAGARLGGVEPQFNAHGAFVGERSWGIIRELRAIAEQTKRDRAAIDTLKTQEDADFSEEIARLEASIAESTEKADALEAEAKTLAETLNATAIDIELKSLPPKVRDSAKRKAKEALKIKGKVSADQQEEYDEEHAAQLLALATVSFTDYAEEHRQERITVEEAREFRYWLPDSEFARVASKLNELEFQASIAQSAVDDPDFSQAGS